MEIMLTVSHFWKLKQSNAMMMKINALGNSVMGMEDNPTL